MNRRIFPAFLCLAIPAIFGPSTGSAGELNPFVPAPSTVPRVRPMSSTNVRRPNIVFILADDAGLGDFSCYGCKYGTTPNIDRLAAEGMRFTQAYSGNAVCAPSRCVLLTGVHPGHAVLRANPEIHVRSKSFPGKLNLPAGQQTVARVLHDTGYATGGFGKWGLGNPGTPGVPEKEGFDLFFGYYDQVHAHNYYTDRLVRNSASVPMTGKPGSWERYSHTRIVNETLRFIEESKDRPFFCYAAWTPPHGDYVIPSDAPYSDKPWPPLVRNYAAMVHLLDTDVGRVVGKLRELGLDRDTLVIFSSDNGANREFVNPLGSTAGLRGHKRMLYEGGIRAPLIARWPGKIKPGTTCDLLTSVADFLPTAADLAGAPKPNGLDGISILPTLLGQEQGNRHESLYFEIYEPYFQQSVRCGDWKAYRLGTEMPLELYNLKQDPAEQHNLAAIHPEVCRQMEVIFKAEHTPVPYYVTPKQARDAKAGSENAKGAEGAQGLNQLLDDQK